MRAANSRRQLLLASVGVIVVAGAVACFRGNSLVDPGGPSGYRAPDPHVAVITLSPASLSGAAGSHDQIAAAPEDGSGQAVAADAVAWLSSDPDVATVSGSGMVTLVHRGKATVTAIADGVTASVGVDVDPPPVDSVGVSPPSAIVQAGDSAQLVATAFAAGAVDSGPTFTWSSSKTSVATVSSAGMVQAVAAGSAVITATSGSIHGTSAITVTSAPPVVASVTVTPSSSTVYPGGQVRLTATLRDGSGNILSGFPVTWGSSNTSAASVSSSGLVAAIAVGSTTITASAGGQSGTASVTVSPPVAASVTVSPSSTTMSPGQTTQLTATARDAGGNVLSVSFSWGTSNSAVATVSSSGVVTAKGVGSANITATAGSAQGTAAITVQSGPSGGFHEPGGMAVQINTGAMSSIPGSVSNFSPSTPSAQGEWSGNLGVASGGTGLRVTYRPALSGGYSPVRFGIGIPSAGSGWYYQRMKVRFSSNWTLNGDVAMKLCEPRTQQTGSGAGANENHVIGAHDFETHTTHAFFYVLLQGPDGHAADLFEQPEYSSVADLNNGAWHTVEVLFTPESTPGRGDGGYTGWVDGTQIAHYTSVQWLAAGNQIGWPYLMFDPTYGGGSNSPNATMYWDFDQLYVSTK